MFNPFEGFTHVMREVFLALLPLIFFFSVMQVMYLRLPRQKIINMIKGLVLAFIGLSLFLQGVHIGFFPIGELAGRVLGSRADNWIMVPLGFVLGFVATFAEPAVRILNLEVEKVSSGSIPQKIMLYTLSIGVGISVALSMLRVITGWPLMAFVIPGYLIALALMFFSTPTFIHIAFDSGGVATGPMTVTFILAIAVGSASVIEGRDPIIDGFGMISLVALAPIIAVLVLGLLYNRKESSEND
jgi:hypothetical protein